MKLHTHNADLSTPILATYAARLRTVMADNTLSEPEAAVNVPTQPDIIASVEVVVAEKVTPTLQHVFVVGIGGSNLGTKAIYEALYPFAESAPYTHPRLHFVDTTNAAQLRQYTDHVIPGLVTKEECLVVTISKSGGTTETVANTEILLAALRAKFSDVRDRTVVITDEGSAYWHAATAQGITTLAIPAHVGGRYSVLTAVGLFPLAAVGIDIVALLQGAKNIRPYGVAEALENNIAAKSAAVLFAAHQAGKSINDNFVFNSELESLGKWYRQLMGESVGKKTNIRGEVVHTGLTPTVSVGSTDLHSVGQLYLGGPKDKITTFIYSAQPAISVPVDRQFPEVVAMISGATTETIMLAIREGTKLAYQHEALPYMEVELEGITPYEIGAFMQFKMMEMMYLGALLEVNPFDQPNVESYKIETKRLLEAN